MHPEASAPRLAWGVSQKYGSVIYVHAGETYGFESVIAFDQVAKRGVVILANSVIEVADLAHKIINSQYRLRQFVPPRQFARALEDAGYAQASAMYEQFAQRDSEFFLTEEVTNEWGYALLAQGRPAPALAVLKLGVYMRPSSANAHDSLAEVYEKTGEKTLARTHYQRSLELDSGNTHAIERLRMLSGDQP